MRDDDDDDDFFCVSDVVGDSVVGSLKTVCRARRDVLGLWVGARGFHADPTPQTAHLARGSSSPPVLRFPLFLCLSSLLRLLRLFLLPCSLLRVLDQEALGRKVRKVCLRLHQARKEGFFIGPRCSFRGCGCGEIRVRGQPPPAIPSLARPAATEAAAAERSADEVECVYSQEQAPCR